MMMTQAEVERLRAKTEAAMHVAAARVLARGVSGRVLSEEADEERTQRALKVLREAGFLRRLDGDVVAVMAAHVHRSMRYKAPGETL